MYLTEKIVESTPIDVEAVLVKTDGTEQHLYSLPAIDFKHAFTDTITYASTFLARNADVRKDVSHVLVRTLNGVELVTYRWED